MIQIVICTELLIYPPTQNTGSPFQLGLAVDPIENVKSEGDRRRLLTISEEMHFSDFCFFFRFYRLPPAPQLTRQLQKYRPSASSYVARVAHALSAHCISNFFLLQKRSFETAKRSRFVSYRQGLDQAPKLSGTRSRSPLFYACNKICTKRREARFGCH